MSDFKAGGPSSWGCQLKLTADEVALANYGHEKINNLHHIFSIFDVYKCHNYHLTSVRCSCYTYA